MKRLNPGIGRNSVSIARGRIKEVGCVAHFLCFNRGTQRHGAPSSVFFCEAASPLTDPPGCPPFIAEGQHVTGAQLASFSGAMDLGRESLAWTPSTGRRPAPSDFPSIVWANQHPGINSSLVLSRLGAADIAYDYRVLADTLFLRSLNSESSAVSGHRWQERLRVRLQDTQTRTQRHRLGDH